MLRSADGVQSGRKRRKKKECGHDKNEEKYRKNEFFMGNVWRFGKNVLPLHAFFGLMPLSHVRNKRCERHVRLPEVAAEGALRLERQTRNKPKQLTKKSYNAYNSTVSQKRKSGTSGHEQESCIGQLPAAPRRLRACVHHHSQKA
jgi:hypothetical protein